MAIPSLFSSRNECHLSLFSTLISIILTGQSLCQRCQNGEEISVSASIETRYIVSRNWAADLNKTVIREDEFLDGDFLTTAQNRQMSLAPSFNCSYIVTAPEGYHVMVAILAMGIEEARGHRCMYFVEFEGTGDGFKDTWDGQYCSSSANSFFPDSAEHLQYTKGQYVLYHGIGLSSGTKLKNIAPTVCSETETMNVNVYNEFVNQDAKYIGFVLTFRLMM